MAITTETAVVYRGGGRRWFSLKTAIKAEARAIHRARFRSRCHCSAPDYAVGDSGETCQFHEAAFFNKFTRRVERLLKARSA